MEISKYKQKSKERTFDEVSLEYKNKIIKNNINWYILHNFTNISDQVNNYMQRLNNDFVKIDIRRLNSEAMYNYMGMNLDHFDTNKNIFLQNKQIVTNELNKILIIKPEFLIDLIKFRTMF